MRLIDADELKDSLSAINLIFLDTERNTLADDILHKTVPAIIDAEPTADVQPVKCGRWVWDSNAPHREYGAYKCSNCGCHSDFKENFCPECGCKQDLDGDSE